jgi:hypothetical protein
MRRPVFYAVLLLCTLAISMRAQAPGADAAAHEPVAVLVRDIRTQQEQLAANQARMDEKLAALAETIRQARIYASRAGR